MIASSGMLSWGQNHYSCCITIYFLTTISDLHTGKSFASDDIEIVHINDILFVVYEGDILFVVYEGKSRFVVLVN